MDHRRQDHQFVLETAFGWKKAVTKTSLDYRMSLCRDAVAHLVSKSPQCLTPGNHSDGNIADRISGCMECFKDVRLIGVLENQKRPEIKTAFSHIDTSMNELRMYLESNSGET
jgi:hypothetical protein